MGSAGNGPMACLLADGRVEAAVERERRTSGPETRQTHNAAAESLHAHDFARKNVRIAL